MCMYVNVPNHFYVIICFHVCYFLLLVFRCSYLICLAFDENISRWKRLLNVTKRHGNTKDRRRQAGARLWSVTHLFHAHSVILSFVRGKTERKKRLKVPQKLFEFIQVPDGKKNCLNPAIYSGPSGIPFLVSSDVCGRAENSLGGFPTWESWKTPHPFTLSLVLSLL